MYAGMISVDEAFEQVMSGISPLEAEEISVADGLDRVLAADVASRVTQPPDAMSAMDGYAVRAEDVASVPVTLTQIGESAAGNGYDGKIGLGETVRIFTGAPLPDGADAIVIQEDTDTNGDQITVLAGVATGRYVRPAGLDFAEGDVLLKAPKRLNSRDIALICAMNVPWISVMRRPRVAILSTGDELVMPGEPIGPNQIISSNSVGLSAFVQAAGGIPINLGIAKDTAESLQQKLKGIAGADMLITIGGASVGDYDLIESVLGKEGLDINFGKVAMRPGKPLIFGKIMGIPMLGLPGNPVSAGVTSALFLKPAIDLMLGFEANATPQSSALLGRDLDENDRRQDYLRSTLEVNDEGELVATPFSKQDSSMLATFSKADCLVIRSPHAPAAKKGARVPIIRLDPA